MVYFFFKGGRTTDSLRQPEKKYLQQSKKNLQLELERRVWKDKK